MVENGSGNMPNKKKYANTDIKGVVKKRNFAWKRVEERVFKGNIALIEIKEVNEEWYVPRRSGRKDCILSKNYKWLEIYPDNEKYAITAMYNEKEELVEFYIDIIKESGIENGEPYIIDMYLDLIITYENEKYILDDKQRVVVNEAARAPQHVLAAARYNNMLYTTAKRYLTKYPTIKKGDKIKLYYISKDEVFGYMPYQYPIEFAPPMDVDTNFEKIMLAPLNRIIMAAGYNPVNAGLTFSNALW